MDINNIHEVRQQLIKLEEKRMINLLEQNTRTGTDYIKNNLYKDWLILSMFDFINENKELEKLKKYIEDQP